MPMAAFIQIALSIVQDTPALEEPTQFTWVSARRRAPRLIGIGQMHNRNEHAARADCRLHRCNQTTLEEVAGQNEIERFRLDLEFSSFQIHYASVDGWVAPKQKLDGDRRAIDGDDAPTMLGQVQGVSAGTARQIERKPGSKL